MLHSCALYVRRYTGATMTAVHGWRRFTIGRCSRLAELCLIGQYGMHVHQNPSPNAECRGAFSAGMWPTSAMQAAKQDDSHRRHPANEAPRFDCTCGFYLYRTFEAMALPTPNNREIIAHVTAIDHTVLHQEGARAQRYRIDYVLSKTEGELDSSYYIYGRDTLDDWYSTVENVESMSTRVALDSVLQGLSVPILDRVHPDGCRTCQIVNFWVDPAGVADLNLACHCINVYQDGVHGRGRRLHTYDPLSTLWVCSVCCTMRVGPGSTPERKV